MREPLSFVQTAQINKVIGTPEVSYAHLECLEQSARAAPTAEVFVLALAGGTCFTAARHVSMRIAIFY